MKPELICFDRPIGVEVRGVDASKPLTPEALSVINEALDRYSVVFLHDQKLNDSEFMSFCATFGPLRETNQKNALLPGNSLLHTVSNVVENGHYIGNPDAGVYWHSDTAYTPTPDLYSMLYGIEVPVRDGVSLGNTSFSSTAAAYDALSDPMKDRLVGLKGVQDLRRQTEMKRNVGVLRRGEINEHEVKAGVTTVHPLVRTHHRSGRKSLYLSEGHTAAIVDAAGKEYPDLLEELNEHILKPEFIYSHSWRVGDILIWDNVTTIHKAVFDYALPLRRVMRRAIISGPVPV